VRIQHILAQALDLDAVQPVSKAKSAIDGGSCAIWNFPTLQIEAARLAAFIAAEMQALGLGPRDFVLLIRQRADCYAAVLEPAFQAAGLVLRNEASMIGAVALQDLLPDEGSRLIVGLLRLATSSRAGRYWSECLKALSPLRGIGPEEAKAQARFARKLDVFAINLAKRHPSPPADQAHAVALVREVLRFIDSDRPLATHPAYAQGNWLGKVLQSAVLHLTASSAGTVDWSAALDAYEGVHAVPLMTIHKSKGLEYHTVIFGSSAVLPAALGPTKAVTSGLSGTVIGSGPSSGSRRGRRFRDATDEFSRTMIRVSGSGRYLHSGWRDSDDSRTRARAGGRSLRQRYRGARGRQARH